VTTDQLRPFAVAAMAALLTVCVWHLVPNVSLALGSALAFVATIGLAPQQLTVERRRRQATTHELFGVTVHIIGDAAVACTAGPLRPRIFLGGRLLALLDDDELRAVVLHERAHQIGLDPLRAAARAAVRRLLPSSLVTPDAVARQDARREIRADAVAQRHGASRQALAAALLKVPAAPAATVGFAPATELRVRALITGGAATTSGPGHSLVGGGVGIVLGIVLCLWGLHAAFVAPAFACCT